MQTKHAVVLLDTREHTPEHEHAVHLKLADGLARLLGVERHDAAQPCVHGKHYYYVPTETLLETSGQTPPGINDEGDLFGGLVSHPYMATKAISHPLPAGATSPQAGLMPSPGRPAMHCCAATAYFPKPTPAAPSPCC